MKSQTAEKINENKKEETRGQKKLNNEIPMSEYQLLVKWAEDDDATVTSEIRQAIRHSEFIREVLADKKKKLLVEENGKLIQIEFR